jgi:hypothetical protein
MAAGTKLSFSASVSIPTASFFVSALVSSVYGTNPSSVRYGSSELKTAEAN